MLGLGILLAHLVGDYLLQDDVMAKRKTESWFWALAHAVTYTLPYLLITQSPAALAVICLTHAIIDRYRLAKHVIWLRNQIVPKDARYSWADAKANGGYSADKPAWMSTWLMIIVDNTIHLLINAAAVVYL